MKRYRYPGTKPFGADQQDLFFGRDDDIRQLLSRISLEQMIVLYSKSGLGKSSLINAGILPQVLKDKVYTPISTRFGAFASNNTESPIVKTKKQIRATGSFTESTLLDKLIPRGNSLWYHIKNQQLIYPNRRKFLLIFDQFEELFTYKRGEIHTFKKELSELLNEKIPRQFRHALDRQYESGEAILTEDELVALHQPVEIKVLLAIRSDRMSSLNDMKDYFPQILRHCYQLGELDEDQACEAILSPASKIDEDFITPPFSYEEKALEKILNFLTNGGKQKIDSFQLQILCHSIEQKLLNEPIPVISTSLVDDVRSIYENYYLRQINNIEDEGDRLAARKLIEEGMIFEQESRRLGVYEGTAREEYHVNEEVLQQLVDFHLIRPEPSLQGGFIYEISHDSLVAPILIAYRTRQMKEEQAEAERKQKEAERKQKEAEARAEKERRQKRRIQWLAILALAGALLAIYLAIVVNNQAGIVKEANITLTENNEVLRTVNSRLLAKDSVLVITNIRNAQGHMNREEYLEAKATYNVAKEALLEMEEFSQRDSLVSFIDSMLLELQIKQSQLVKVDSFIQLASDSLLKQNYLASMFYSNEARVRSVGQGRNLSRINSIESIARGNLLNEYSKRISDAKELERAGDRARAIIRLKLACKYAEVIGLKNIAGDKVIEFKNIATQLNFKCTPQ